MYLVNDPQSFLQHNHKRDRVFVLSRTHRGRPVANKRASTQAGRVFQRGVDIAANAALV